MNTQLTETTRARLIATAGLLLIAALAAGPVGAEEEERRIVKKVRIECESADCEAHEELIKEHAGGDHAVIWSSGDAGRRMMFKTHHGGGFLGVQMAELTPELRLHFGVAENAGVMISKVVDDSPAAKAGLRVGDIVTAVDGVRVGSGRQLAHSIRGKEEGAEVLLEVWRDGAAQSLTATVEERAGELHAMDYAFVVKCDDAEDDCSFAKRHLKVDDPDRDVEFDCQGADPCEVKVICEDAGDCTCTVNGEETDCSELPGFEE